MPLRETLTKNALGGNVLPLTVVPLGAIPVPGFDASYVWFSNTAGGPLTRVALGGAQSVTAPSGGILAVPDPLAGTVVLQAWWAWAQQFSVTRVDSDGSRVPVRGADAWTVTGGRSRRNLAAHPANAAGDLVGWTAAANTSLTALSSLPVQPDDRVSTGVLATATAAGTVNVTFNLDAIGIGVNSYGLWVDADAAPSSMALTVAWYDVNGSSLGTSSYPIGATAVAETALGWSWCSAQIATSPYGAVFGFVGLTAAGMSAGATLSLTGRLWESGPALGPYFDGSYFGANWAGTKYKSSSTLAPVQLITDAEAPLDTPMHYEISNPAAPGYVAATTDLVLPSAPGVGGPRTCLLTHPGLDATVRAWVEHEPDSISNPLDATAFSVIGRRNKVVVTDTQRGGDEGSLTLVAETFDERRQLQRFLDDGSPLLLRFPADHGHPPLWWLSFPGAAQWKTAFRRSATQVRTCELSFIEVDRPSTATRDLAA